MDNNSIGLVPIDQPSNNPDTAAQRAQAKGNLWRIDRAIDDGQVVALPDDGKRPANNTIIPEGRNSV